SIVKTAEYTNPKVADYIVQTLMERRRQIAVHWLDDVNPIAGFAVENGSDGVVLKFDDLLAKHDLADRAEYRYEIAGERRGEKISTSSPLIPLGQALAGEVRVKI